MEIEVSRAELDEVQGWLDALSEAGNAEDGGASENVGSEEAQALSEYLESEGVRGAGVVAACKGVPVLVEVILETENQRMLNALMGACVGVLPARKIFALRALVSIAKFDHHRASVAGSGVLGIASAAAVAAKSPAALRALCFEAVGLLASDDDWETSPKAFDERRVAEFVKLRAQALSVGCVDAMVSCLVPSAKPDEVRLCSAAASAIARLAPSADVAPLLLKQNCLSKCLKLLQQREAPKKSTKGSSEEEAAPSEASKHGAAEEAEDDEDEDEYDWSFACERPALKVLVGILKQRPNVVVPAPASPAAAEPTASEDGDDNTSTETAAGASLFSAVATPALLDALVQCLEASAGTSRRSEAHALATDCLRRLAAARDAQGQPLILCRDGSPNRAAPSSSNSASASDDTATAVESSTTASDTSQQEAGDSSTVAAAAPASPVTVASHLLSQDHSNHVRTSSSDTGGGLLRAARRVITLAPAGAAAMVDLLAALCAADSAWQDAVAEAGLVKVLARAVQDDHAAVLAPSAVAAGGGTLPFSAPFSTRQAPARPTTLLGAWAVLLQSMLVTPPAPPATTPATAAAASSMAPATAAAAAITVPGSARAACASLASSLALLLAAPKPVTRAQAIAAVHLLFAGKPPQLVVPPPPSQGRGSSNNNSDAALVPPGAVGALVGHFFVSATATAAHASVPAASLPPAACAPAALRAASASYDLPPTSRSAAAEVLSLMDRALASEGWTAATGSSSSSSSGGGAKSGKSKKRRNKNGALAAAGAAAAAGGSAAAGPLAEALARQVRAAAEAGATTGVGASGAVGAAAGVRGPGATSAGEGAGLALKAAGNSLFGQRLWCDALAHYEAASAALDDETEDEDTEDQSDGEEEDDGSSSGYGSSDVSSSCKQASSISSSGGSSGDGSGTEGEHDTRASLRVSLRLNAARCLLRLWDEPRCLAACAYAEAAALAAGARATPEAAPSAVSAVLAHLKAQLWCQLGGSGWTAADGCELPAKPWSERRQYLRRARDVLKSAGPSAPRASQKLLRETILALKAGPSS